MQQKTSVPIRLDWLVQTILDSRSGDFQKITITVPDGDEEHNPNGTAQITYYHSPCNDAIQPGDITSWLKYGTKLIIKPEVHNAVHALVRMAIMDALLGSRGYLTFHDIMRVINEHVSVQYENADRLHSSSIS